MDDLTRERYGPVIPYAEQYALPVKLHRPRATNWRIRARRVVLCGTADLGDIMPGGDQTGWRNRRLLLVIRRAA